MFSNLDTGLNVTLTILVIIAGAFLFCLLMSAIFAYLFARKIKKANKGLEVILATKGGYLKKIYEIAAKIDNNLDPSIVSAIEFFNSVDLKQSPTSKEFRETVEKLTFLRNEMDFLIGKNEIYSKHEEFLRAKASVEEMDVVYQRTIANYNSDIGGYNYWISFLPCRWLYRLLKLNKKELI